MTLQELIATHPEWADLPVVVHRQDGGYDYIGEGAGSVYVDDDDGKVLVFAAN